VAAVPAGHAGKGQVTPRPVVFKSVSRTNCEMGRGPRPYGRSKQSPRSHSGGASLTRTNRGQYSFASRATCQKS
jgi:hypothetical protein